MFCLVYFLIMSTARGKNAIYVRNVIFGVEDSLVSTVGFLSGLASVAMAEKTMLLAAFVYIFVEGFSMAVGSFLSEESTREYESGEQTSMLPSVLGALAMLVSSIGAGFVPILPYLLANGGAAIAGSIIASLALLGVLGYIHARLSKLPALPRIARMVVVGGMAIIIGVCVGHVFTLA